MISQHYSQLDLNLVYLLLEFQDKSANDPDVPVFKKQRKNDIRELVIENALYSKINEKYHKQDTYDDVDLIKYKSFNEILNRTVTIESPLNLAHSMAVQNLTQFTSVKSYNHGVSFSLYGCKFNFYKNTLNIRNAKVRAKPSLVVAYDFKGSSTDEVIQLANDITLCNVPPGKCNNTLQILSPILTMNFNTTKNLLTTSIRYQVNFGCSVNQVLAPNVIMKINRVIRRDLIVDPIIDKESRDEDNQGWQDQEPTGITSQDFYDAMQSTAMNLAQPLAFELPELTTSLLRFQTKTVKWLLVKEGVRYNYETNRVEPAPLINQQLVDAVEAATTTSEFNSELDLQIHKVLNSLCFGWERVRFHKQRFWYNKYNANLIDTKAIYRFIINYHRDETCSSDLPGRGLLSEEMGLGKTVEVVSLVLLNQQRSSDIDKVIKLQLRQYGDLKSILKAKTTLIIAPDSILKQWVDEVIRLAPSLAITVYEGVQSYPRLQNNPRLILNYLKMFDIVFTTYSVLSKELDYALYSSKNSLTRSSKKESNQNGFQNDSQTLENGFSSHRQEEDDIEGLHPDGETTTEASRQSPELENDLCDYQSLFQLSMRIKKPQNANQKTNEDQPGTDYELALEQEIIKAMSHSQRQTQSIRTYQSPLMMLQFWRVVLDEVQMVSSKISRAFQSAALIPRYHSWGVSGTPIKKNLNDLHSVLSFLRVSPFIGEIGKNSWETITTDKIDFCKVWSMFGIRHTKAMVKDDIKLPPQNRMLLTVPFNAVEQENYNTLLAECLGVVCLDGTGTPVVDDWEPTKSVIMVMKQWLVKLRQVCGNPQVGKLNLNTRRYKARSYFYNNDKDWMNGPGVQTIQALKTLYDVLDDMVTSASNDIINMERDIITDYSEFAQLLEMVMYPEFAMKVLDDVSGMVQRVIARISFMLERTGQLPFDTEEVDDSNEDVIKGFRTRLRLWKILLHKCYFLLGSSYFQLYDEEYRDKIQKHRKVLNISTGRFNKLNQDLIDELLAEKDLNVDIINSAKLMEKAPSDSDEDKFKYMEQTYYDLSEQLRLEILSGSIKAVQSAVESRFTSRDIFRSGKFIDDGSLLIPKTTKKLFKTIPMIEIDEEELVGIKIKFFYEKIIQLVKQLNEQGELINKWVGELITILSSDLLSYDKDPNGEEYEKSITDQDKAASYFQILSRIISDRLESINGKDNTTKIVSIKKVQEEREFKATVDSAQDQEFIKDLDQRRKDVKLNSKTSLNDLVHEVKNMGNDLKDEDMFTAEIDSFDRLANTLSNIFDNQKLATILIQKELTVNCNFVFNARVEYFKQLQQISDGVKMPNYGINVEDIDVNKVDGLILVLLKTYNSLLSKLDKAVSKFRYLKSLACEDFPTIATHSTKPANMFECVICRSTITIGSLTHCGHKYCKDCLEQWLKARGNCPMCKTPISFQTIHNFTHYAPNLKATRFNNVKNVKHANLYSIYKHMDSNLVADIQNIHLKDSYSSKVDMIVKQILYLKSKDPKVQIVVFSQWQDLLYILATAFKSADISYLASYGTLTPEVGGGRRKWKYESVEQFKDPNNNITCFLLNARAQASGLTLINASHIFLCEPLVNTSLELQAISRIHRIGQTKVTTVWMFAIENTVEESIVLLSTNKRIKHVEQQELQPHELTEIESKTLAQSGGIDTMVHKGAGEGETVSNSDLWDAFFCATSSELRETMNIDTLSKI